MPDGLRITLILLRGRCLVFKIWWNIASAVSEEKSLEEFDAGRRTPDKIRYQ